MKNSSNILKKRTLQIEILYLIFCLFLLTLDYLFVSLNFLDFPAKTEQIYILAIFLILVRMTFGIDFGFMRGHKYLKAILIVLSLMYFAYIAGLARTYFVWQDFDELEAYVKKGVDLWSRRDFARRMNDIMIFTFVANLVAVPFFVVQALRSIWRQLRREENPASNLK